MTQPVKRPRFSAEQVQLLEQMFPEQTGSGQSFSDLQYRAGQRSVLDFIKRSAMVEVRYVQREVLG
ncbi:hypothetical protein FDJ56_gp39 [Pectobacterium phage vB_PatP_CB5]|uniref:Uncharacterized protein n=1 Tax=Pectobacterium phage vB_PatP_CB5 TaxID=1983582 RepID=A0A2U7NMC2_9CAUD|nr:hypothetical protein FDJ56_gp39 [Pectobacterium phage vB_PatP_CB5]ARW59012.1 hypothetical protein CB5_40 [Pectobacterium phage vB_PatP_CB5]